MRHCTLILNAWNDKHWIKPELLEQPELLQVKLTLHIQNEPINEPINELLSVRQKDIIAAIRLKPSITREELADITKISLATIKREITTLRNKGYINRDGSNKSGLWILLKGITE